MSFTNFKGSGRNIFLLAGALASISLSAQANTSTWNGGTADWNTSGSWTGGIPAPTDTATFGGTTASTATISTGATATSIGTISVTNTAATLIEGGTVASTLNIGAGGITLGSGGGNLTFGGTGVNALNITLNGNQAWADNSSAGSLVVTNNVTNASTSTPVTLTLNGSAKGTTINGIISDGSTIGGGTTALLITNSGANVTLNGTNTYTGGTTLTSTGGTLYIDNATALGTGAFTINSGTIDNSTSGVLDLTGNNPINVNGSFTYAAGTHSMDLGTGNVTFTNNDTVTVVQFGLYLGGNVSFATPTTTLTISSTDGTGTLIFGNDSSAGVLSAGGTWSGATTNTLIVNSGATLAFDLANNSTVANNITVNGFLQGREASGITNTFSGTITGAFAQNGAGTSVITGSVSGATSFASGAGTIQLGNGTTSGSFGGLSSGAITLPSVISGATLAFDQTTGTNISTNISEAGTVAGAEGSGITNTLSGIISSTGGFSQSGTGTTVLSNANTFSGSTAVTAGTLDLTNALALQDSTVTPGAGSLVFDSSVSGNAFTFAGLSGSTNLALLNNAGTPAAIALTVGNNNVSSTYTGILSGAGSSLIKTGTGTLTLGSNVNSTYGGGTSVNSGLLAIGGSSVPSTGSYTPLGSGTVTVNSAGTIEFGAYSSTSTSIYTYAVPINLNGGKLESGDGYEHLSGPITVSSTSTLAGTYGDKGLYLDGLLSGSGNLTVVNSGVDTGHTYDGTIVFITDGSNTYSGTIGITPMSGTGNGTYLSINATNALADATVNLSGNNSASNPTYSTSTLVFTGPTAVTLGALTGSGNVALTNTSAAAVILSVGNNNSGNFAYSGAASGAGGLTMVGSGTFTLSGTDSYTGATTVSGGALTITGTLGNTAVNVGAGTLNLDNASAISQNTLTVNNASGAVTENTTNALAGTLALTQSNGTVTLSKANNFNGGVTLSGGTLQLQNAGSIASSALGLSGGILQLRNDTNNTTFSDTSTTVSGSTTINVDSQSGASVTGNTLLLGAVGIAADDVTVTNADSYNLSLGTVTASAGPTFTNNMTSGTLTLGALTSTASTAQTATFNGTSATAVTSVGVISQGTGVLSVAQSGSGTTILTGANTYTGTTSVTSGTLVLSGNNTSATGATNVSNGATLQLVGNAGNNGGTSGNTNTSISASSALTLGAGSTLQLRDNVTDTFAPASISTSGNGTFNFDVNNATSGTNQTLTLSGAIGFGSANQQINVTGGNGYVLGLGALTFNTTSNNGGFNFAINATSAATTISSFQYGSYGGILTLEGGNNITIGGLIFSSNGNETLTVSGANVTLNGGTSQSGRNTGTYAVNLNSGTLNLNNAGDMTNLNGVNPPSLTISGGTLDNTSGGSITQSTNAAVSLNGSFTFTGSNNLNLGSNNATITGGPITINTVANTLTMGALTGSSAHPINLTKTGTGTLTFGGVNASYGGTITVDSTAGVLNLGTLNASQGVTSFVNNGGTATLGALSFSNGASVDFSGAGTTTTTSTNGANGILGVPYTVNNGADFAYNSTNASGGTIEAPPTELALPTSGTTTATSTVYYVTGSQNTGANTIGALRITDTVAGQTLNLGSNNLVLTPVTGPLGGILYSGSLGSSDSYTITGTGYVQGTNSGNSLGINVYNGTLTLVDPLIGSAGTGSFAKYGNGTLVLTAPNNTYTGTTTVGAGTLDLGNGNTGSFTGTGTITLASGSTLGVGLASGSTVGGAIVDSGAIVGNETSGVTNTLSGIINPGALSQTGGLTQNGAGTTILSNTNFYVGATAINAGAVEITNAGALGSVAHPTSGVTVASGGALQMSGGITTTGAYALTLNGTGLASESTPTGALESLAGANSYTGAITLASNASIGADSSSSLTLPGGVTNGGYLLTVTGAGNTTLNSVISGTGGLTMSGTGTTTLSASSGNTYTGETIVSGGELDLNSSGGFSIQGLGADTVATAPDILVNGGTLKFLAANQLANAGGSGNVTVSLTSGVVNLNGMNQTLYAFQNTGGTFMTGTGHLTGTGATTTFAGGTNTINPGGTVEDDHFVISGGTNTVQGGSSSGMLELDPSGIGIVFSNGANLTLNSDNANPGELILNPIGGSFVISTTAASTTASITNSGSLTDAGTLILEGNTADFSIAAGLVPSGGADLAVSAVIQDGVNPPGSVYKTGAGILALSGANLYTGGTTISQGTVIAGVSNVGSTSGAFGPKANGIILGDSGTANAAVALLNAGFTVSNPITVSTTSTSGGYTIGGSNTSGTATYSGSIAVNKALTLQAATGGTTDFTTGTWTTHNNAFTIGSSGNLGNVQLDNALNTSSGLSLKYGTLTVNSNSSSSAVTMASGTTLGNNSGAGSVGAVTMAGNDTIGSSGTSLTASSIGVSGTGNVIGTGTVNGAITQNSSSALTVSGKAGSDALNTSASLTGSGSGSVTTVTLAGSDTLSGPLTTTGITVSGAGNSISSGTVGGNITFGGGTSALAVYGTASGTVAVTNGATLSGTGSTGVVTVSGGGNVNLQDSAIDHLTVAGLTTGGGTASTLYFDLKTLSGSTTLDYINDTGNLTLNSSTTINIGNLSGTTSLVNGTYTLISVASGTTTINGTLGGDLTLAGTAPGLASNQTLSLIEVGNSIDLKISSSVTPTSYTLTTSAGSTLLHVGQSTGLTTTLTNTGTGLADSIDYTSVGASTNLGSVGGSAITGNVANGNTAVSDNAQIFSSSAAGVATISSAGTLTNHTVGGTPSGTPTGTTVYVYSGQSTWTGTGASGYWGTGTSDANFGLNWGNYQTTGYQGSPGVTTGYTGQDTATFTNVSLHSAVQVNLGGATPNLNSITFNAPATSYTLGGGSDTGTITLSGTTPAINVTAGSHTIAAPVVLGANTSLAVATGQQLTISGNVSDNSAGYGLSLPTTANGGGGTTILNNSAGNNYGGGTTVAAGKLYVDNASNSGTGSGSVSVTGGTLAGTGSISGQVSLSGGSLYSGGVPTGQPNVSANTVPAMSQTTVMAGLTLTNTSTNVMSPALSINSANLTFALGTDTTSGGAYNYAHPSYNSTWMQANGLISFSGTDTISLVDLTNTGSGGTLTLRQGVPYLLISNSLGDAGYYGLVTTTGYGSNTVYTLDGNGYVVGDLNAAGLLAYGGDASGTVLSGFSATDVNSINIAQYGAYGANGLTEIASGAAAIYPAPALYLYDGNLEVVPEPGTWALMLGGLAVLIVIQRRKK